MKTGYYFADTINGVFFDGTEEDTNYSVLSPDQFYYALEDCADDDILQAYFDIDDEDDLEVLKRIENEFGITP